MGYLMPGDDEGIDAMAEASLPAAPRIRRRHLWVPWLVALITLFLWWLVTALKLFPPVALPSPGAMGWTTARGFGTGEE